MKNEYRYTVDWDGLKWDLIDTTLGKTYTNNFVSYNKSSVRYNPPRIHSLYLKDFFPPAPSIDDFL